ncbi:protein of unknown function [[Clostridium] aminophilum]|uniref:Uncharacterized protein n=1 Tax=[Clostridium] aminophilum TaxID=1526 RepID=A0A1I0CB42_9FIRM|nr:DUF4209 domain-containing protein [[Clostridium] aminophilum]SET16104.1 protein of unknown function [[Clostridium] aminophilum]
MNIYELINEIYSSSIEQHWDNLPDAFYSWNREKLEDGFDLEVFDLAKRAYEIRIIYRSDRRDCDTKQEYWKCGDASFVPFTDYELQVLNGLDWTRLPHAFKAHIYDVIWLINHKYEAAKTAAEEYYYLYHEWFDEVNWVQCVDYISRAVELATRIGISDKKEYYLTEVYKDIIRLNGDDASFLSISLIELIANQNYHCDFSILISLVDRVISNNQESMSKPHVVEQAYYQKAHLYRKLKDSKTENNVYVQYADFLMMGVENLLKKTKEEDVDKRDWFLAERDIKKAIELFQNHAAPEKALDAQKRLVEIQKEAVKHIPMHEFKYDLSKEYEIFISNYGNHNTKELIWDVIFAVSFQNKQKIREKITKRSSILSVLVPRQILGAEGQTEFVLPALDLSDENNILLHMYFRAKEDENIYGQTIGRWFIQLFRKMDLQESDLDLIFENNPIIPKGQEKDVQRGVYYGLTGHMSDALDKLAPKMENIIRNLAEMCGDLMTYYDTKKGIQKRKVLSQVFIGEKLKECIDENVLFTFDGLLQQKAGSNIRNRIGHGLNTEDECFSGDCIYFVMIVLKYCAFYCGHFIDEMERHIHNR